VSFYEGLLPAMRQAPEAVLAGEVRDQDAAQTAILGGESGALMLVTTHGSSIVRTLKRILALSGGSDAFRSVLAGSLIGVVRLDLVPHVNGKQFSLVNETLMGTSSVVPAIQADDWATVEQICSRQAPTQDFFPMKPHIDALVKKKQVSLDVAGRLQYAR
jgi:Tfp pilus assembly pilus retraction ATPase PilT